MEDVYKGEKKPRNIVKYVLVSVIGVLALTVAAVILFDVPFIEEPLHEFLLTFVPEDAFVWQFIKITPIIELPHLPSAPDEIIDDIIEIVINPSRNDSPTSTNVISDIGDVLTGGSGGNGITPLASINENDEITVNATEHAEEPLPDIPTNVIIPEFVVESNRILSEDARFSSIGASSIGDSFTGVVTQTRDGNSLYVSNYLLVLAGVKKDVNAISYMAEICPVGANVVYDIDDLQSPSRDGGLYAAVWCFVPGLPNETANQLVLESGLAGTDYSCISSEFRTEKWLVDAGCPG